jgi:hypothetical protein
LAFERHYPFDSLPPSFQQVIFTLCPLAEFYENFIRDHIRNTSKNNVNYFYEFDDLALHWSSIFVSSLIVIYGIYYGDYLDELFNLLFFIIFMIFYLMVMIIRILLLILYPLYPIWNCKNSYKKYFSKIYQTELHCFYELIETVLRWPSVLVLILMVFYSILYYHFPSLNVEGLIIITGLTGIFLSLFMNKFIYQKRFNELYKLMPKMKCVRWIP